MGSAAVHKSLWRCEFMISIWRNTGNVCGHRVQLTRAFGVALLAILARPLPGLANGGASDLDPKPNAFSHDIQASG
jgi:hypothetical protein